jgi:hypothetical protein
MTIEKEIEDGSGMSELQSEYENRKKLRAKDIEKCLLNGLLKRDVVFDWKSPVHDTLIKLLIPDLSDCAYSVWGDWGPMYRIDVNAIEPFKIEYRDKNSDSVVNQCLEIKNVELNSPMLHEERKIHPLFFIIPDEKKGFIYHLFFNIVGKVDQVKIIRLEDKVELYKSDEVIETD